MSTVRKITQSPYIKPFCAFAILAILFIGACLLACSETKSPNTETTSPPDSASGLYVAPVLSLSPANVSSFIGNDSAWLDLSNTRQGYINAKAQGPSKTKLIVKTDYANCIYDLPHDGSIITVPLNLGNGSYTFRVMSNTTGDKYIETYATQADVILDSEFVPFIRPNRYCNYSSSSTVVTLGQELAKGCYSDADVVFNVYDWVTQNVTYDYNLAETVPSGYIPDPDKTISSKTGICFDYASLVAALLRSQGIPTKITNGYVTPENAYHSWNQVYFNGTWRYAVIDLRTGTWSLMDPTFGAAGQNAFTGNGDNYSEEMSY